jgi:OmpA-OmpF porin, OOP family
MNYNAILQKIFAVAITIGFVVVCSERGAAQNFDLNNVPVVKSRLGTFPYFSLIEGYQVFKGLHSANEDVAFDRYEFFDGTRSLAVEGRLKIVTASGKGASTYEVLKTYESLVKSLGGVRVWEGRAQTAEREIGEKRHRRYTSSDDRMGVYLLRTPDKEVWVEAYTCSILGVYFLTVVEKKPLTVRATLLTAAEMKKELDSKGRVPLYINFDTDKADIKPDAQPAIDEIFKLLKMNSAMKLRIEGHTDNNGPAEHNKQLSEARARSISAALTKFGIAANRLLTVGVGPNKPIDDNSTEEGRAKNRRVELVKIN